MNGKKKNNKIHKLILWKDKWSKILAKLVKERGEKETLYIKIDIYTMKMGKITDIQK